MFACVLGSGSDWPGVTGLDSGAYLAYGEAVKRSMYVSELLYPAVIPLAGTLPPSTARSPPLPPKSGDLKFGIDRILASGRSKGTFYYNISST